ncbi:MAG TPA: outer membrane protein assembly factor BamE [Kiloniellales bacterium]|nr:outer membrane protein assembly factor BamE [Kiloniellales bacterium]
MRGLLLAGLAVLALSGCESGVTVRGNMPDPDIASQIQPGVHTREDVSSLLGSPSTISTFQDRKWYYIGQKTSQFAFFEPEILERDVLVVSFDEDGRVAETRNYDLADAQQIDPVDRITPTEGKDLTILQQLLGNIGRFGGKEEGGFRPSRGLPGS